MGVVVDIALILACLAIIIKYTVKGFAKVVLGVIAFFASLTVAGIITPLVFGNASFIVRTIANVLIFLTVYVVLNVVFSVVNKIFKLPILGGINTFLGFLFGLICAYIMGSFLSSVLSIIIHVSDAMSGIGDSFMYNFFSHYGTFALIEIIFIV